MPGRSPDGKEGLLEVVSMAEGIRRVTGTESSGKRIQEFVNATVKLRAPNTVRTNRTVSRLVLGDLSVVNERTAK